MKRAAGLAFRDSGPEDAPAVLLVHGYPESSYMWHGVLPGLAEAGRRGLAPDMPGFGDSEPDPPGTWERQIDALERFVEALDPGPVSLVTHDWGVLVGLRWACDHPERINALVISDGGFFADRRWHDFANTMRTPGEGEQLIAGFTREAFDGLMKGLSAGIDAAAVDQYWKGFAGDIRRQGHLDLYRSGDFDKLEPYAGRLSELGLPALILWGAQDRFATVAMAERFRDEIPDSELRIFDDAGHFLWDDEPPAATKALIDFLARRVPTA
jgi:haloalkane dehalogenase